MKQLSLLILAGLTTGCFAADQAQPKVLRFGQKLSNSDRLEIDDIINHAARLDNEGKLSYLERLEVGDLHRQYARLEKQTTLSYQDRLELEEIASGLIAFARKDSHEQ